MSRDERAAAERERERDSEPPGCGDAAHPARCDGGGSWDDELLTVPACERCSELVESRSQIVNGTGPKDADLLFVGEAPGANEDREGEPFVGQSGDVLDEGLRDVGLDRADVRITNTVRCRPPENRDPTVGEQANCRGYLSREIAAVDPELVITLGKVPTEQLLGRDVSVTNEAGQINETEIGDRVWRVMVCVHPAATMYDPSQAETLEQTLTAAVEYATDGGQSTFEEF